MSLMTKRSFRHWQKASKKSISKITKQHMVVIITTITINKKCQIFLMAIASEYRDKRRTVCIYVVKRLHFINYSACSLHDHAHKFVQNDIEKRIGLTKPSRSTDYERYNESPPILFILSSSRSIAPAISSRSSIPLNF
jgi:hypothetical protein